MSTIKIPTMQDAILKAFVEQRFNFRIELSRLRDAHQSNALQMAASGIPSASRTARGAANDCTDIIHAVEFGKPDFLIHVVNLGTGIKVQAFQAAGTALGLSRDEMRDIAGRE